MLAFVLAFVLKFVGYEVAEDNEKSHVVFLHLKDYPCGDVDGSGRCATREALPRPYFR